MSFPSANIVADYGTLSGRIAPTGAPPADGDYSFVLGSDVPGVFRTLMSGDFFEVAQIADLLTDAPTHVRVRVHSRPPTANTSWQLSLRVDNNSTSADRVVYRLDYPNDREGDLIDFAIPLRGVVSGTRQRVVFKLELLGTVDTTYDVELPGVYLDSAIVVTEEARPALINMVPSTGQTNVRVDTDVWLEINDPVTTAILGGNIDLLGGGGAEPTRVYLNDVLALEGTTFQPGFDGPESAVDATLDGNRTVGIRIDLTDPFPADSVVSVRVETRAKTQDPRVFNYSFRTEDLVAPRPVNAVATARRVVVVDWSEDVVSADATAVNDALNPANWVITVETDTVGEVFPAFTPTVISVVRLSSFQMQLELNAELTPGALYSVAAVNVEDLHGNQVVAQINEALFSGFSPQLVDGREFDIWEMLPQLNRDEDETRDLERFVKCLQEVGDQLLTDVDGWTDILDPDVAPERFVDAMLLDLGNPFDFALDDIGKRRLVRVLVPIYRQKGTDPGIINAVRFFSGLEVTIEVPAFDDGWLLGVGELGVDSSLGTSDLRARLSFWIRSTVVLTAEQRTQILKIGNYMKRAETHILGILEPEAPPDEPSHWELGLSELGVDTYMH